MNVADDTPPDVLFQTPGLRPLRCHSLKKIQWCPPQIHSSAAEEVLYCCIQDCLGAGAEDCRGEEEEE
jgi:hypothetical protein